MGSEGKGEGEEKGEDQYGCSWDDIAAVGLGSPGHCFEGVCQYLFNKG